MKIFFDYIQIIFLGWNQLSAYAIQSRTLPLQFHINTKYFPSTLNYWTTSTIVYKKFSCRAIFLHGGIESALRQRFST